MSSYYNLHDCERCSQYNSYLIINIFIWMYFAIYTFRNLLIWQIGKWIILWLYFLKGHLKNQIKIISGLQRSLINPAATPHLLLVCTIYCWYCKFLCLNKHIKDVENLMWLLPMMGSGLGPFPTCISLVLPNILGLIYNNWIMLLITLCQCSGFIFVFNVIWQKINKYNLIHWNCWIFIENKSACIFQFCYKNWNVDKSKECSVWCFHNNFIDYVFL